MGYPTLEQYQEALQHPATVLIDHELKHGTVKTTGLGMPLALCGGFALTYTFTCSSKKYAVRCFHKESRSLEARYAAISRKLRQLSSPYFLDFEFQPQGIRIDQKPYPLVKMAWASGETLGEFLETNHRNKAALQRLRQALKDLGAYLEKQGFAHGDIQTGNVMVANGGANIQLIDYDGMFVEELRSLGSSELGHRNFQHPDRARSNPYDKTLDRFSLIALTLALHALEDDPSLWSKTRSDIDGIIFRANDYADPESSPIFSDLFNRVTFSQIAKNFAAVCKARFSQIPSLDDFLTRRGIPQAVVISTTPPGPMSRVYIAAYPVLDATDYLACLKHVGDRIELIGRIVEVKEDKTRYRKPYIFINFGHWRGEIVKISIWSEGLAALSKKPDRTWMGKWISVTGLMEPPYRSKKYKYSHLAITVTQNNQMTVISEEEARFRLAGSRPAPKVSARINNTDILERIGTRQSSAASSPNYPLSGASGARKVPSIGPRRTPNQAVLDKIRQSGTSQGAPQQGGSRPTQIQVPPSQSHQFLPKKEKGVLGKIWDFFFG